MVGFLFLGCGMALGQNQEAEEADNNILVVSYFKCQYDKMPEVRNMVDVLSAPILNNLVDEGKLQSWGSLNHLWGDEWNFIIYYNAGSLGAFEKAHEEFFSQSMESNPEWMEEFSTLCSEHKDNIYSVVNSYSGEVSP